MPSQHPGAFRLVASIAGITGLCLLATFGIGYIIASAASDGAVPFGAWLVIGFLAAVEFLGGAMAINVVSRSRSAIKPSVPVMARTFKVFAGWAAVGLVAVSIYALARDGSGPAVGGGDLLFASVLAFFTLACFAFVAVMWTFSLSFERSERPIVEARAEQAERAIDVERVLRKLRSVQATGPERARLERSIKKLEVAQNHLKHHAGGVGTYEAGREVFSRKLDKQARADVEDALEYLNGHCKALIEGTGPALADRIGDIEAKTAQIETATEPKQLA
ncbi:MAG: hypothetical protein ACFCVE_11490 [Phycisphaerae bacterium]